MKIRQKIFLLYAVSLLFFLCLATHVILDKILNHIRNIRSYKIDWYNLYDLIILIWFKILSNFIRVADYYKGITFDYTFWDEFRDYTLYEDSTWAIENLLPLLTTYSVDYVWTYNIDAKPLSYYQTEEIDTLLNPIATNNFYNVMDTNRYGEKRFCQFFIKYQENFILVLGATVHATNDPDRIEKPTGFFFVAKIIDSLYIDKLSIITDSKVALIQQIITDKENMNHAINYLSDYNNQKIGELIFSKNDNFLIEDKKYGIISFIIYVLIIIFILINAVIFINKVISKPLKSIQYSLDYDLPTYIEKLAKKEDEYGNIAKLILEFFRQKEKLKEEIQERQAVEEQLKENLEELRQKNEEINAQSEELEKINEDLEKLSIVASKTENSVIIASSNYEIEFVNEGFLKLYELSQREWNMFENKNLFKITQNQEFEDVINECTQNKKTVFYTIKNKTFKNNFKWVQTTLTPTYDLYGRLEYLIFVESDVTNIKIAEQKITEQNKNINDSIQYAKRIQNALLPASELLTKIFTEYFIFYRPKQIISGDFYWILEKNNFTYFAVADCTGHGVPGAFMSILSISLLNDIIINAKQNFNSAEILEMLREMLIARMHQTQGKGLANNDGLDISFVIIDKNNSQLQFSGAHNPMLIVKNNTIEEIDADMIPVSFATKMKNFSLKNIKYDKDDKFYMFSDGFLDQFGEFNERKYTKKRFKTFVQNMANYNLKEQAQIIEQEFDTWKGAVSQLDDVLVIGFKLNNDTEVL